MRLPRLDSLRQQLQRESGIALVMALVTMLSLTAFGAVVVSFAQSNAKSVNRSADTSVADALAEAGMNSARAVLWNAPNPLDPNAVEPGEISLFGGTATYHGQLSGSVWTLTGISHVRSGSQDVSRTVSTQVAVKSGANGPSIAIFSADSDCGGDSLRLGSNSVQIDGAIRSNGDLAITGTNVTIGSISSFGPPCLLDVNSQAAEGVKVDQTVHYWPAAFEETDFYCTFRARTFRFNQSGMTIPDGVYCADESFSLSGNNLRGKITAIAPEIKVFGANHQLAPYQRDVLFFATGAAPMSLAGSSYQWSGIIYHPGGEVQIRGDEYSMLNGMIEAREVATSGKAFRMIGTGPASDLGQDGLTLVNVAQSYVSGRGTIGDES